MPKVRYDTFFVLHLSMKNISILTLIAYTLDVVSIGCALCMGFIFWLRFYCTIKDISLNELPHVFDLPLFNWLLIFLFAGIGGIVWLMIHYQRLFEGRYAFVFRWNVPFVLIALLCLVPFVLNHFIGR